MREAKKCSTFFANSFKVIISININLVFILIPLEKKYDNKVLKVKKLTIIKPLKVRSKTNPLVLDEE